MNEERAPREGPSRRSEGAHDGSGGDRGSAAGVPRQAAEQFVRGGAGGVGGPGGASGVGGAGRRRAGAPQFGPAELAAALQDCVSAVGSSGPPRAGVARIRRRAKARQRRRTVMAGSAGVLVLAMAVSVVTGNSFDIVPVLTGVVGLGGSNGAADSGRSPQGGGQVRTVRPPAGAAGKKGPAIGPADAVAGVPTALAATGVPQCTPADLTTVATVDLVSGGVSYGHVEAIAQHTCAVAGPPVLQVENAAGTAAASVVILQHAQSDGSQLPNVLTWGAVLKLQAGQGYDFQFAWAPDACVGPSVPPAGGQASTPAAGASGPASTSGHASASAYTLSYLVGDMTPTEPVDLTAACGATVYVTDVYDRGAYPLPQSPASPSPHPSTPSAPATSPSPTTAPPSSAPSTTASSPAAPSSSASSSSGSSGGSPVGNAPSASAPVQPTSS